MATEGKIAILMPSYAVRAPFKEHIAQEFARFWHALYQWTEKPTVTAVAQTCTPNSYVKPKLAVKRPSCGTGRAAAEEADHSHVSPPELKTTRGLAPMHHPHQRKHDHNEIGTFCCPLCRRYLDSMCHGVRGLGMQVNIVTQGKRDSTPHLSAVAILQHNTSKTWESV
ncbi:Hypothetical predicted protein [Pelobates cultripes]|uniref:Uncharacterized protein n=1 Tax=Pelobates cultripes TaxID=61616 RepID=A0AAD1VMW0_PELCU|nr:Hypothetical predicted protein [Pelobates cultripes]